MSEQLLGFIGLGNMGGPMAVNLAAGGNSLICFDTAGTTERAPQGAKHASSVDEIAQQAEIIFFAGGVAGFEGEFGCLGAYFNCHDITGFEGAL